MDYKKLWEMMKEQLSLLEHNGNMLQQTLSSAYLQIMNDLEQGVEKTEMQDCDDSDLLIYEAQMPQKG